jgi:translocation and assembly module TamB
MPVPDPSAPDTTAPVLRLPAARGGPLWAFWHLAQPVLAMLLLLALVGGLAGGAVVWLLRSAEGTAWLLARLPGIEVQGPRGALLSDAFAVERVVVRWDQQRKSVTVEDFRGEGLRWSWHPNFGAWVGLEAQHLQARRVDIQTGPPGPRPIQMPRSLQLPLRLQAQVVDVATLQIDHLPPIQSLRGQDVALWEPGGREYRANTITFDWDRARIEGAASLAGNPPYTLQATARLRSLAESDALAAWTADVRAAGPLARLELQATLRGSSARRGATPPALDVDAAITPLDAWPIGRLRLTTQALDLSALLSGAPRTALSGRMDIDSRSLDGPLAATVALENALPGRWNEGRVPVRRLQGRLRSPDANRGRLLLEDVDVLWSQGAEEAGRWRGSGEWVGTRLQVDSQLEALRPHLLDGRAPVMNISGPLAFTVQGMRSPDPYASGAAARRGLSIDLRTSLDGQIEGSPHAVKVSVDGSATATGLVLRELRAEAGSARVLLTGDANRKATGDWQVRSTGSLTDFDPVAWWPGLLDASAWRRGGTRLSGNWVLDLAAPKLQADTAPLALLQGLVGTGQLRVERSLVAGLPVSVQLELGQQAAGTERPATLRGEVLVAGNRLVIDGQGQPLGNGHGDRLRFDLQAGELAALAPLLRLAPDLAAWAPASGSVDATVDVQGRWPDVRSLGKASLKNLRMGALAAQEARASWQLETASDQPLLLQVDVQGLAQGKQRLDNLTVDLRGTLRQHVLDITAALPLSPPQLVEVALGLRTGAGTLARLRADGRWGADGNGGGRWAGNVSQLSLGPWGGAGRAAPTGPGSTWLDGRNLSVQVRYDAADGLSELQAAAGQVRLAEAAVLRWDDVRVDLRGAAPAYVLRADIEPFALAPLLARTRPSMGWAGDLRLAARVDIRAAEKLDADIVFERRDGDLRLAEENASQPFGLTDLRLVASAHEGLWQVAGAFAGKTLGEASGRLNLRTRPAQRWPSADTPIDGLIEGHVANLGVWGSWVPPGWRLSGELRTSASVSGRVGDPNWAGEVRASNVAVRNLLLGVDVRQGEAKLRLQGAEAEIESFTLRGGEGVLRVTGRARLDQQAGSNFRLEAERFRVLGRVDRQLIASGALDLGLGGDALRVAGRVRIDEGLFDLSRADAPSLDDDVTVRRTGPAAAEDPATTAPPRVQRNQQVQVEIDLGQQLKVRGRGLDTTLGGNLKLGSTAGRLTLHGIVSASGGTYAAYGQKLEIERGVILFNGDVENPTMDVLALRPNLDMQVGVAITGPVLSPRVRLYASSDLSESDKLSWLVLGRASDGLARADTALLQRAAIALLAGEGEAPTDTLLRSLGIDELSVRQSDSDVRETVVSLGKQLSRRWYVGYERGVNATTGTFQLIYRIAQRFTLRAQSGLENSLDLIWVWRLQDPPPSAAPVPKSAASAPP